MSMLIHWLILTTKLLLVLISPCYGAITVDELGVVECAGLTVCESPGLNFRIRMKLSGSESGQGIGKINGVISEGYQFFDGIGYWSLNETISVAVEWYNSYWQYKLIFKDSVPNWYERECSDCSTFANRKACDGDTYETALTDTGSFNVYSVQANKKWTADLRIKSSDETVERNMTISNTIRETTFGTEMHIRANAVFDTTTCYNDVDTDYYVWRDTFVSGASTNYWIPQTYFGDAPNHLNMTVATWKNDFNCDSTFVGYHTVIPFYETLAEYLADPNGVNRDIAVTNQLYVWEEGIYNSRFTYVLNTDEDACNDTTAYSPGTDPLIYTLKKQQIMNYINLTLDLNYKDILTFEGTLEPTRAPTKAPTRSPSRHPTRSPSKAPTRTPSRAPSLHPTPAPTYSPTRAPSDQPTPAPTRTPSDAPTRFPTKSPTRVPTAAPSSAPSYSPTKSPTKPPTNAPTRVPTKFPSSAPTKSPSSSPIAAPTHEPTTPIPSQHPTTPIPSRAPTTAPPTDAPTRSPTGLPTRNPTKRPTKQPTQDPTLRPTNRPTVDPTMRPTRTPINLETAYETNAEIEIGGVTADQISESDQAIIVQVLSDVLGVSYNRIFINSITTIDATNGRRRMQLNHPSFQFLTKHRKDHRAKRLLLYNNYKAVVDFTIYSLTKEASATTVSKLESTSNIQTISTQLKTNVPSLVNSTVSLSTNNLVCEDGTQVLTKLGTTYCESICNFNEYYNSVTGSCNILDIYNISNINIPQFIDNDLRTENFFIGMGLVPVAIIVFFTTMKCCNEWKRFNQDRRKSPYKSDNNSNNNFNSNNVNGNVMRLQNGKMQIQGQPIATSYMGPNGQQHMQMISPPNSSTNNNNNNNNGNNPNYPYNNNLPSTSSASAPSSVRNTPANMQYMLNSKSLYDSAAFQFNNNETNNNGQEYYYAQQGQNKNGLPLNSPATNVPPHLMSGTNQMQHGQQQQQQQQQDMGDEEEEEEVYEDEYDNEDDNNNDDDNNEEYSYQDDGNNAHYSQQYNNYQPRQSESVMTETTEGAYGRAETEYNQDEQSYTNQSNQDQSYDDQQA